MTIGSAASRPSHELAAPLTTFPSLEAATPRSAEPALAEESDAERAWSAAHAARRGRRVSHPVY